MIESNGDETTTEANSQMETNAIDEPFIETDTQEDYFLPSETNMPIVIDEQEHTPNTEVSEIQPIGEDVPRMKIEPTQTDEDQPPPIQMDQRVEVRQSARMQNSNYIKVKTFKGMSAVGDDEAAYTLTEAAFTEFTLDHDISKETFQPANALLLEPYIPINYNDAVSCPESEKWKAAIQDEYNSIIENKTWDIVPLPENRKAIKGKWVLDFKPAHKGAAARYKARFVACGYAQLYGIDYFATYSPVVKHYSIRLVLAIAATKDLEMVQLDIKTAFLYGELKEEIYMLQPEGYALPGREDEVCKLLKCLYGLKQSSRCWFEKFDDFITKFGFTRCQSDPCVYYRFGPDGEYTILIIYVDDGLLCSNRTASIDATLQYLRTYFQVRALPASRFVGLDITRDRPNRLLYVNQSDFIRKMLRRYNMEECNPSPIPANKDNRPSPMMSPKSEDECNKMAATPVREALGSLMYLMAMSRPDIALAVNQVAAYVSNPGQGHWEAVKLIFAYLSGTNNYGICYGGEMWINEQSPLQGFTDANFAMDLTARKSTTGILFQLFGGPISWESRRQRSTALSTTDADIYAASEGSREAIWLKTILGELNIDVGQIPIFCDSRCAISIIENPENHQRVKHIDIKYFFVREQQNKGTLILRNVPTKNQLADMFTKPLGQKDFENFRKLIGVKEVKE